MGVGREAQSAALCRGWAFKFAGWRGRPGGSKIWKRIAVGEYESSSPVIALSQAENTDRDASPVLPRSPRHGEAPTAAARADDPTTSRGWSKEMCLARGKKCVVSQSTNQPHSIGGEPSGCSDNWVQTARSVGGDSPKATQDAIERKPRISGGHNRQHFKNTHCSVWKYMYSK